MAWTENTKIDRILSEVIKLKIKKPRPSAFRVSSLPYCHIRQLYEDHHATGNYNYKTAFYTSIGNAMHGIMQEFLPRHPTLKVFGNWACARCHKRVEQTFNQKAFTEFNLNCPQKRNAECSDFVEYKELQLNWKYLSGHTDMLLYIDGEWYLLDFKTTSSALWRATVATMKSRKFPSNQYINQIETYAALLYKLLGIKISHVVICYLGRDSIALNRKPLIKSFAQPFSKRLYQSRMRTLEQYNDMHQLYRDFKAKPSRKLREQLITTRPCQSAKDYTTKMGDRFFFQDCENWTNYVCKTNAGVEQFLKDVALLEKVK